MKSQFRLKFTGIILVALILPIVSYTIFQFTQRSEEEKRIRSIYNRQLETILFSVNQHCWDTFRTLTAEIESEVAAAQVTGSHAGIAERLTRLISKHSYVLGLTFRNSSGQDILVQDSAFAGSLPRLNPTQALSRLDTIVNRCLLQIQAATEKAEKGYVRPFHVKWDSVSQSPVSLLLFPIINRSADQNNTALGGAFIDQYRFVEDIVVLKFNEIEDGNIIIGVEDCRENHLIYSSAKKGGRGYERFFEEPERVERSDQSQSFEKRETLWILPDLELVIRLKGTTLDQMTRARTRGNLIFIALANVILILGVMTLLRNISRQMALAQMKTDFVANVSHELRTPLALIRMHAETLEMGRVHSEQKKRQYYQTIVHESARLTQLINNILDFTKIESRKKKYHFEPANLSDLVRDILDMYRFNLDQKGFELQQDIEVSIPDIKLDREAITLALVNLLDNAAKFSSDQKWIGVSLKSFKDQIILSVQDKGIGIPDPERKKIFKKFYRIESSLVHDTKGSGLGLSLVKHIMEIHHGRVTVQSKQNVGSTFSLIFPMKRTNPSCLEF
jgi:two-component system phosphate regulon sensor histidine kinase PhoR